MRSIRMLLVLLIAISSTRSSVSALKWTLDSKHASCEGDPFTNVYINASCTSKYSCNNSMCTHISQCGLGDIPEITGRLTAVLAFPNSQVVVKPCLSGICSSRDSKIDGRICSWIKPVSGQECGDVGDYQFDYLVELPNDNAGLPEWLVDMITVKIQVVKATGCQTAEEAVQNDGYELPYPLMGLGAVAGLAFALCRDRRRRRYDEDEDEDDESFDEEESYIEMGESKRDAWSPRRDDCHSPDTVPSVVSSRVQHQRSASSASLASYKPPPVNLPQNLAINPGTNNHEQAKQQISLEELRGWYEKLGIAIV